MGSPLRRIKPTGNENTFELKELFFSTTNEKGIITSGNETFANVSAYVLEEMIGKPHNIIRHPSMPRAVFATLWRELKAGRPVAAYTCNLAKDGNHYWVLAYVAPITGGFLSVRLEAGSSFFEDIKKLYKDLLEFEQSEETSTAERKRVILESTTRLEDGIKNLGYSSYETFMQAAVQTEVKRRKTLLATAQTSTQTSNTLADPELRAILQRCRRAQELLQKLSDEIDQYSLLTSGLETQSDTVLELAENIQLFSLNAQLAATRLGERGTALLAVAQLLNNYSAEATPAINSLSEEIQHTIQMLGEAGEMGFSCAVAQLQLEMMEIFIQDLETNNTKDNTGHAAKSIDQVATDLASLRDGLSTSVDSLIEKFGVMYKRIVSVTEGVERVSGIIARLKSLEVNGRVESARINGADDVELLFMTIGEQVRDANNTLRGLQNKTRHDDLLIPHLYENISTIDRLIVTFESRHMGSSEIAA